MTELNTEANAISDRGENETDATTGWSVSGAGAQVLSISGPTYAGSFMFATVIVADTVYKDIATDFSLVNGQRYLLSFRAFDDLTIGYTRIGIGTSPTVITDYAKGVIWLPSETPVWRLWSLSFVYEGTKDYIVIEGVDGGAVLFLDNLSFVDSDKIIIRDDGEVIVPGSSILMSDSKSVFTKNRNFLRLGNDLMVKRIHK